MNEALGSTSANVTMVRRSPSVCVCVSAETFLALFCLILFFARASASLVSTFNVAAVTNKQKSYYNTVVHMIATNVFVVEEEQSRTAKARVKAISRQDLFFASHR